MSPRTAHGNIRPGFIYKARIRAAKNARSSLLLKQPHVNDQVQDHPTMVWDVYEKDGVAIARCLQMTSFRKRGVEVKYPTAYKYHCQYLPVSCT